MGVKVAQSFPSGGIGFLDLPKEGRWPWAEWGSLGWDASLPAQAVPSEAGRLRSEATRVPPALRRTGLDKGVDSERWGQGHLGACPL